MKKESDSKYVKAFERRKMEGYANMDVKKRIKRKLMIMKNVNLTKTD